MKPLLKWAGGKRWLLASYPELFDIPHTRIVEPFVGSGAVFFQLESTRGLLGDKNGALINLYRCLKGQANEVERALQVHAQKHSVDYYYFIRGKVFKDPAKRAAQFLYLNRTCWNGLYRENRLGKFNVPKGTKSTVIFPDDNFAIAEKLLRRCKLIEGDFSLVLDLVTEKDFVFVDPPYTVRHNNNGFLKYNETIFSWHDQERLASDLRRIAKTGVSIMVCNAFHNSVIELYETWAQVLKVSRSSILAGDARFRGKTYEAVILIGESWSDLDFDKLSRKSQYRQPELRLV